MELEFLPLGIGELVCIFVLDGHLVGLVAELGYPGVKHEGPWGEDGLLEDLRALGPAYLYLVTIKHFRTVSRLFNHCPSRSSLIPLIPELRPAHRLFVSAKNKSPPVSLPEQLRVHRYKARTCPEL